MRYLGTLLSLLVTVVFAYAATTNYTITLNRKETSALLDKLKRVNAARAEVGDTAFTAEEFLQDLTDAQVVRFVRDQIVFAANPEIGIILAVDEIYLLPVVTGQLLIQDLGTGAVCLMTLNGATTPSVTENADTMNRCTQTKDTSNRINFYWDVTADAYMMQNSLSTERTLIIFRTD